MSRRSGRLRRLKKGEANERSSPSCATLISIPSKPASAALRALTAKPSITVADIILVHCLRAEMAGWLGHLGRRPHDMRRMLQRSMAGVRELAKNLRAVAWTASVIFRSSGMTAGSQALMKRRDILPVG